jgi:hypothetical protein
MSSIEANILIALVVPGEGEIKITKEEARQIIKVLQEALGETNVPYTSLPRRVEPAVVVPDCDLPKPFTLKTEKPDGSPPDIIARMEEPRNGR